MPARKKRAAKGVRLARGNSVEQYGLRICRQATEGSKAQYSLIISDGAKISDMVMCE